MATPIRNTPILFGKDARDFLREINTPMPKEERIVMWKEIEEGARRFRELVRIETNSPRR